MKLRVVRAYGPYRKGDLIEPAGVYRDVLLARGYAEPVDAAPTPAAPEKAEAPKRRTATKG